MNLDLERGSARYSRSGLRRRLVKVFRYVCRRRIRLRSEDWGFLKAIVVSRVGALKGILVALAEKLLLRLRSIVGAFRAQVAEYRKGRAVHIYGHVIRLGRNVLLTARMPPQPRKVPVRYASRWERIPGKVWRKLRTAAREAGGRTGRRGARVSVER